MSSDELYDRMERCAEYCFKHGITSAELYARADDEEHSGFSVSAPYTRLLATLVKEVEMKHGLIAVDEPRPV